jgi:hypothetical protein
LTRTCGSRYGALIDLAEHVVDVHDVTFLFRLLCQHARLQGRDFHRDLVGIQLDHRIAGGDGIALLLEPPRYGGLDDRFSERGDLYGEHSD